MIDFRSTKNQGTAPEQGSRGFVSEDTGLGFWLFLLDDIWTTTLCVLNRQKFSTLRDFANGS